MKRQKLQSLVPIINLTQSTVWQVLGPAFVVLGCGYQNWVGELTALVGAGMIGLTLCVLSATVRHQQEEINRLRAPQASPGSDVAAADRGP
jgi:hypothetical protein